MEMSGAGLASLIWDPHRNVVFKSSNSRQYSGTLELYIYRSFVAQKTNKNGLLRMGYL